MDDLQLSTIIALLGAVGVVVSIIYAMRNGKRADTNDEVKTARQLERIETTLESVRNGVDDIRSEMRNHQKQLNDHEVRITRIEARRFGEGGLKNE